jgi:Tol biopolymer transport system component
VVSAATLISVPVSAQNSVLVDAVMTEGTNLAAAVSPDGETLIIALQGVLWSLPVNGGDAQAFTPAEMDAHEPVWAPDGSRVAFYAFVGDAFAIWTMKPDGSDLNMLANGVSADARYPAFTADSRQILYSSDEDYGYAVWMTDRASGERRPLTSAQETGYTAPNTPYFSGDGNSVYPTLSPDNTTLAWVIDGPEDRLVVRDLNASLGFREIYRAADFGAPLWAPDGNSLYIVGINAAQTFLANVPVDGMGVTHVVEGGDIFPFRPSIGPDGTLYYTADGQVMTLSPDGTPGSPVPFTAKVTLDRTPYVRRSYDFFSPTPKQALGIIDPILSPDGTQAAFAALGDLWHADLTTGVTKQLTDDVYIDISPSWSPDGERIAWVTDRSGIADVYTIRETGECADLVARWQ